MHHITTNGKHYTLRFDMRSYEGDARYAEYRDFVVSDEESKYQLTVVTYTGDAGMYR